MKRLLALAMAALVTLTGVGALTASPSTAGTGARALVSTTHQVDVATLPVGPRAKVAYLTGRVLHTRAGKTVTIDVPKRFQDSLELLGRSARGGWVVGYHHDSAVLAVSPSGKVRQIAHYYEDFPGASQLYLSTNGRLVAIQGVDEGDAALFRVVDLAGRTVARHNWISGGSTVAFQGRTLWFSQWGSDDLRGSLITWRMGHSPRHAPGDAQAVQLLDLTHHQLVRTVRTDPDYDFGVTSVSHPKTVRWTVCETCRPGYSATAFSPDGHGLLGELGAKDETVRSAEDGSVQSDLAFSLRVYGERWEGNRHVLVEVTDGPVRTGVHALLRCSLGGSCARVTKWQHHWLLSYQQ
ncbi:MAG TPA: hypothetical protein VH085_02860 [Nocardioides sp.]|nr:hypothetical protein [Nocardioides sp.]